MHKPQRLVRGLLIQRFITGQEQRVARARGTQWPDRCEHCRGKSGLVPARLPESVEKELTNNLLGSRDVLVNDLREILATAFGPVRLREPHFLEWFFSIDTEKIQLRHKYEATEHGRRLIAQRTALVQELKTMVLAMGDLQNIEVDTKLKTERGRLELQRLKTEQLRLEAEQLKLEAERLELEEQIAQRAALADDRLRTEQLQETTKQARLRASLEPPPPPPPPEPKEDPSEKMIAEFREHFQTRATARQVVISDFLKELRQLYDSSLDDSEKALRIRVVVETYRQEPEAVPREIREFLERFDSDAGVTCD